MEIYDINRLLKVDDELYDLIQLTFQYDPDDSVVFSEYKVKRSEEMRIESVCNSIYGTTDFVDILCSVNNIDNPLNIKEGETIFYPREADVKDLRFTQDDDREDINAVINSEKRTKQDPNRQDYNNNNQSIPPTILPRQIEPVDVKGAKYKIGEGLF